MGQRFLLDSNIAIYFLNGSLPNPVFLNLQPLLQTECNVSIITKIEILGWQFPSPNNQQAAENFLRASNIYFLTDQIANQTILIRRTTRIKLPDAVIAATALIHGFTLITRNESDFSNITGLNVINPFTINP